MSWKVLCSDSDDHKQQSLIMFYLIIIFCSSKTLSTKKSAERQLFPLSFRTLGPKVDIFVSPPHFISICN